jgi:nitrous oxidase accessory protein NosD
MIGIIARAAGTAALIAYAAPVSAGALSYVSITGVNTGNCDNPKLPCRSIAYAVTKTTAGGEIKALTAGDLGSATINKSLTLTGVPGATIFTTTTTPAINISAGSSGVVVITGFTFNGLGTGQNGVRVASAGSLVLRNCAIKNFTFAGVQLKSTTAMKFSIEDSFIANTHYGVQIDKTGAGSATGVIHRSTIIGKGTSGIGVFLAESANARVSDSLIGHFEFGIYTGASAGNVLRVTRNTVSQNVKGVYVERDVGAVAETAHDNFIAGNTTDVDAVNGAPLTNVGTQ